jgi:hypothetical protein
MELSYSANPNNPRDKVGFTMMYIVIIGNPVTGFTFQGPFDNEDEASDYAGNVEDNEAWYAPLELPDRP